MLIYEITATVDDKLTQKFESYMIESHIPDIIATGHFVAASIARSGNVYRIDYQADSQDELDKYLAHDAERLRADFAEHFPTGVSVARNVFEVCWLSQ